MENKCTILVNSCDNYQDTWIPFFYFLKLNWTNIPYNIVLNTESKDFCYEDLNIKTFNLYKEDDNIPWGKRFIETLKLIDSKYVITLLDDFYLEEKVDQKIIDKCINWMELNDQIVVFSFYESEGEFITSNEYENFGKRAYGSNEYKFNCQAAIWRRESLITYIKEHESPWDWEIFGSNRKTQEHEIFYNILNNKNSPFQYDFHKYGLIRGKWAKDTVELFKENKINVDFQQRGFYKKKFEPFKPLYKYLWFKKLVLIKRKFDGSLDKENEIKKLSSDD